MHKRLTGVLLAIIFSLLPWLVFAEQIETKITADLITIERGKILYADGNVKVEYGNNIIQAKSLIFNQNTNEIKFKEVQDFYDGKAIRLSADKALISSDLSEGIILTANLLIEDSIKIQ